MHVFSYKKQLNETTGSLFQTVRNQAALFEKAEQFAPFIFEVMQKACQCTVRTIREPSLLILGTRTEDNFTQLEKISYPILNKEKFSYPTIFQQHGLVPNTEVFVHKLKQIYRQIPHCPRQFSCRSSDLSFPDVCQLFIQSLISDFNHFFEQNSFVPHKNFS